MYIMTLYNYIFTDNKDTDNGKEDKEVNEHGVHGLYKILPCTLNIQSMIK
jgi:hypothetical protein